MKFHSKLINTCLLCTAIMGSSQMSAHSQTLQVNNHLEFGEAFVHGASGTSRMTVNPDSSFSADADFIVLSPPTAADIDLLGGNISVSFTVDITQNKIDIAGSGGQDFRVDNFTVGPPGLMTDSSGNAQFFIGGRVSTKPSAGTYPDDTYSGTFDITIVY